MKRKDLREVLYQQVKSMGFDPREEVRKENEKLEEKRKGIFHKLIEEPAWEEEHFYVETLGLIEDYETKQFVKVSVENIEFIS